jgi:hypothetical protein
VETDRVSQYYQVPYAVRSLDAEQVAALRGVDQSAPLHLPEPNQFIAEDVSMVEVAATNPPVPAVALQLPRQQIWFQQDDEFKVPKGATYINFRSPEVGQNARQTAAAVLYTALLKDNVNEFAYPAMLAGLSFDIYKHAQGMSLRISGYNDKQAVLLQELLGIIEAPQFDPARFENIRKDMIRSLENAVANPPINQVMNDLRESLLYGEWGEQPLIDAVEHARQLGFDSLWLHSLDAAEAGRGLELEMLDRTESSGLDIWLSGGATESRHLSNLARVGGAAAVVIDHNLAQLSSALELCDCLAPLTEPVIPEVNFSCGQGCAG